MPTLRLALLLLVTLPASAQFANITHTGITDVSGAPLAHGSECFTPVNNPGVPIPANYPNGTATKQTKCYIISAGALQSGVQLVRSNATTPANLCYQVTIRNTDNSQLLIGPTDGWGCVNITGDINLNTAPLNFASGVVVQPGPPGLSAYQLALQNGFVGTVQQFLASLVGSGGPDASAAHYKGVYSGSSSYAVNDVVTANGGSYLCIAAATVTPPVAPVTTPSLSGNLFDQTAVVSNSIVNSATGAIASPYNGYTASGYIYVAGAGSFITNLAIQTYIDPNFNIFGIAFYDGSHNYLSGTPASTGSTHIPPSTAIIVPSNAVYARFWWLANDTVGSNANLGAAIVNAGTTLQSSYTPYNPGTTTGGSPGSPSPAPGDTTHWVALGAGTTGSSSLAGKHIALWGDSLTDINNGYGNNWEAPFFARTGAVRSFVDGRSGRSFSQAFEYYQNNPATGTNTGTTPISGQATAANTGTPGNTIAQDLAGIDLMIGWLGTNEGYLASNNLGASGDATNAGTLYGYIRYFIEGVLAARPGMQLILVTPYQTSLATNPPRLTVTQAEAITTAIKTVAGQYGVPVYDALHDSGLSKYNIGAATVDGVHDNATVGGPLLAAKFANFAQQQY